MKQIQDLYKRIIAENVVKLENDSFGIKMRETRSGNTASSFGHVLAFDLREGFPAVTTKKLAWKAVVGELLWFLSGSTNLKKLREYTELDDDAWTIWSDDCKRWHKNNEDAPEDENDLGEIYSYQWRDFGGSEHVRNNDGVIELFGEQGIDQIQNLITSLREQPESRYHLVSAWNPVTNSLQKAALPPCHYAFQCYVTDEDENGIRYLDLMWHQRSVDSFLGLPFNIASYGLLLTILARLTGCRPRFLKCTLGDTHIYEQHLEQCQEMIDREPLPLPTLKFRKIESLEDVLTMKASDFKLDNYVNHGVLKGKLSVGE